MFNLYRLNRSVDEVAGLFRVQADPGREVDGQMAVVILGGLMTSMALNLLVLLTLMLAFGRFYRGTDQVSS